MSSFGTQKVATTSLNVGFPDPYAYWYAGTGRSEQYMPERQFGGLDNTVGDDYQAHWHQQKKRDANYMATAKVRATQVARAKAFSSPHGYYNLPPPVLGQRKFANPSYGSLVIHSTRLDTPGAPWTEMEGGHHPYASRFEREPEKDWSMTGARLVGGVLRTTVGQDWAKAKLNDRIKQFNAIDEAKSAFQTDTLGGLAGVQATGQPFAGAEASINSELSLLPQVELAQLLQNIVDALTSPDYDWDGITKFLIGDANKIFALCVRLATHNSADDITNALEFIEGGSSEAGITQLITNALASYHEMFEGDDEVAPSYSIRILETMENLFKRLELYLKQMLKLAGNPLKDRETASKALIKSLGFTKAMKTDAQLFAQVGNANRETLAYARENPLSPGQQQKSSSGAFIQPFGAEEFRGPHPSYFPHSHQAWKSDTNFGRPRLGEGAEERWARQRRDHFTREAPIREDTQHGYVGTGGATFSRDYRGAFGDQSGRWIGTVEQPETEDQTNLGGREVGYLAEDVAEEGGAEEGAEGQALAQLSADASSAIPHLRSQRDPATGAWNIGVQQEQVLPRRYASSADVEEDYVDERGAVQPGQRPGQPAVTPAQPKYKESQVPRSIEGLKQFIAKLRREHPGYRQVIYDKAGVKPGNVRRHTLKKMVEAGLL